MSQTDGEQRFYQAFVHVPWHCHEYKEWLWHEPEPIGPPRTDKKDAQKDWRAYKKKMCGKGGEWEKDIREARARKEPIPSFSVQQIWPPKT